MENHNGEMHVETDSARGGSTPNIVRWVLGISLLAAIVLLSIIWMTGALTHDGRGDDPTAMSRIQSETTNSTDGIVSENADEFDTTAETGAVDPGRIENTPAELQEAEPQED